MSVSIKPLEDRILVQTLDAEQTTASGLVIPDTAKEKPQEGKVLAVGPGRFDEDGDKLTSLVARHLSTSDEIETARLAEQAAGRGGRNSSFMALITNGMPISSLRKAFYELLEGVDAEAKKKAFFRAKQWAVDQGFIDLAGDVVIDLRKGA